ncbi:unnamed protein product [Fraxinus pennsylvanica]|uniref:Nal1 N-terminal domain-containing protein n=1 Tax=Fraxinus pennsylvanica TaxID=56036 RepID=A0AAD2E9D0_9LAMI|nr:unnamed protein product [Fraxinus pennsylvanica]
MKIPSRNLNLPFSSPVPLQTFAGGQVDSNAAYFSWPTSSQVTDTAKDRARYFGNLQKGVLHETIGRPPSGQQATTLLELMIIRAFHSKFLRRCSLGTVIGCRIRRGAMTDILAILVFVARKVHRQWLSHAQCLPTTLKVLNFGDYVINFGYILAEEKKVKAETWLATVGRGEFWEEVYVPSI